jgi:fido (protein-threonine AMPylation protein)
MARPRQTNAEKLARALKELYAVTGSDKGVIKGNQLKPVTRTLLLEKGFLREVLKGWYFVSDPHADEGDTTPFFANYWEYLAKYLGERFGKDYCLSSADSLLMHAQCNVIPKQVSINLAVNQCHYQELAHGYSLMMFQSGKLPNEEYIATINGLRCMSAEMCLTKLPPTGYHRWAEEVLLLISTLNDPGILAGLYEINTAGISRIVGAARKIGRTNFADSIVNQLSSAGYKLVETNPFKEAITYRLSSPNRSPLYNRIKMQWEKQRQPVLKHKPDERVKGLSVNEFLDKIEAIKIYDAYHSLSIERYRVTEDLIKKVESGEWSPEINPEDRKQIDAMAAKGYLDTFKAVKEAIGSALNEKSHSRVAAEIFSQAHQGWYQLLFKPSVDAGILQQRDLFGYRRNRVFLRGSLHSPPHYDYVLDGMEALKECLLTEEDAFVRAVLGHWLFGFIHPYMDGNGRMARFTMNLMLTCDEFPWTIIKVDDRQEYMAALEKASVEQDIEPFARFISKCISNSYPKFMQKAENG